MEQRNVLMSALSVGVGVGIGLGLASQHSKWSSSSKASGGVTTEKIEQELLGQVIDGRTSSITFDEFPYYLSEQTRVLLTSTAYVHLKQAEFHMYTRNLSPASRTILLSGPAELYKQMLAKALAQYFDAKLLLFDVMDLSLKISRKYGAFSKESCFKRSTSETALEHMSRFLGPFSFRSAGDENRGIRRQGSVADIRLHESNSPRLRRNASAAADISVLTSQDPLKRAESWSFDEKLLIQALFKVLVSVSSSSPIILYLRDVERLVFRSQKVCNMFQKMLKELSGPILILGSKMLGRDSEYKETDEQLSLLFPYNIEIKPPEDKNHLISWKSQLEEDKKMIQYQDNRNHIAEVLAANDLECDDLGSICSVDTEFLSNYIEEIVMSAISYHLMNNTHPEYRSGKLVISSKSLSHGLSIFQHNQHDDHDASKLEVKRDSAKEVATTSIAEIEAAATESKNEVEKIAESKEPEAPSSKEVPDNEFEKRIRPDVIPANEITVTFEDIGALDEIKESLQELIMLPVRRPDIFKGGLLKPCRGILLFGPPGTGKTMMAKAIAKEAGASFINVTMATITSKWFGEDEKTVRALFSLAAKISPTIIFVDEVDSMLGQRSTVGEHEAMRKIKNEFMTHWDGLRTKPGERILVLGATNRPFDLDEAIIRRFERRIMVGLPSLESREKILRTILLKEKIGELDFKELAAMTEGYSGSDLKNLCITALYRPVRELIQAERIKDMDKNKKCSEARGKDNDTDAKDSENSIFLRPLNMEDVRLAKNQVAASSADGLVMNELKRWNELYGEGGSRKKEQLTYFL